MSEKIEGLPYNSLNQYGTSRFQGGGVGGCSWAAPGHLGDTRDPGPPKNTCAVRWTAGIS